MPDVLSITLKLLWSLMIIWCINLEFAQSIPEDSSKSVQLDQETTKRDWDRSLHSWGKRGWNNLHGGWGLKRSIPDWNEQYYPKSIVEKRAWQNLQAGWGKRSDPDDEYTIRQLASLLDENQLTPHGLDMDDLDENDDEKRNWDKFHGGWGKRDKWGKFRGSWGKREPTWSNLRGMWGK